MTQTCPLKLQSSLSLIHEANVPTENHNFIRSMRLSTDGTKLLSIMEDRSVKFSTIPYSQYMKYGYYSLEGVEDATAVGDFSLDPAESFQFGESIYDVQWLLPTPDCENNMLISMRDHPIHLFDVSSKTVKASYVGHDHLDELETSLCLTLNSQGTKFYAGANRKIRCFDLNQPGNACTTIHTAKNKKAMYGQKGLISCLQFNPDYSGCFAAGSYLGNVSIYVENSAESVLDILSTNCPAGVTHVRWSPDGQCLWTGGRKSDLLTCWDVRTTKSAVGTVSRKCSTNQRMIFDIDPWGQYLASGTEDGNISIYDTTTFETIQQYDTGTATNVNTCLFHPYASLLVTAIGDRHIPVVHGMTSDDSGSEDGDDYEEELRELKRKRSKLRETEKAVKKECSCIAVLSMDKEIIRYDPTATTTMSVEADVANVVNEQIEEGEVVISQQENVL